MNLFNTYPRPPIYKICNLHCYIISIIHYTAGVSNFAIDWEKLGSSAIFLRSAALRPAFSSLGCPIFINKAKRSRPLNFDRRLFTV